MEMTLPWLSNEMAGIPSRVRGLKWQAQIQRERASVTIPNLWLRQSLFPKIRTQHEKLYKVDDGQGKKRCRCTPSREKLRQGMAASLFFPSLFVPLVLLLLPLSRPASVVTHLPGSWPPSVPPGDRVSRSTTPSCKLPCFFLFQVLFCRYVRVDEETGAELFYYFVESERSPDTDPVVLWMTGGPFCSGMIFFEVGETLILRSSCVYQPACQKLCRRCCQLLLHQDQIKLKSEVHLLLISNSKLAE